MKSVMVPFNAETILMDETPEVYCPHCGAGRLVEPDANYVVECEGCGEKYKVYSFC